jgi:hypothetical protein
MSRLGLRGAWDVLMWLSKEDACYRARNVMMPRTGS